MNIAVLQSVYRCDKPEWFRESLESILGKNDPTIHLYLGIDGELTPELNQVVDEYLPRIHKLVKSTTNLGLAGILNLIIKNLGDEELIARMDSDDISIENRFELQKKFMLENPGVDILGGTIIEVDEFGEKLKIREYNEYNECIVKWMSRGTALAHPTVCMRRKVIDELVGYSTDCGKNEDIELWFRCIDKGFVFHNLQSPLLRFRRTRGAMERRNINKAFYEMTVYLKGIYRLKGIHLDLIFPIIRFFSRLLPIRIRTYLYNSNIRKKMLVR